jgi:hypothetical protein
MGTTKGGHLYLEAPDQSAAPTARMDGVTLMDGSATMQSDWAPADLGLFPYNSTQQAWVADFYTPNLDPSVSNNLRLYVSSYSDTIDLPLVRVGLAGATPSVVVTLPAEDQGKVNSASNVTPLLVTSISASVTAPVAASGKLLRPIGVTVNLTGLPANRPVDWAYQLIGYVNGDLTTAPFLVSGYETTDFDGAVVPAGPDGVSVPHTFAPQEPTAVTSITIYAVAGLSGGSLQTSGGGAGRSRPPAKNTQGFQLNNIIAGVTASCVISIGTVTGVTDPTAMIQTLLDTSVGVNNAVFGVLPLGVDNARIALLAVDTTKLAGLAVTAAKLAASSVTATAIANLAVGNAAIQNGAISTAMIQNGAITNALIGNLAVGTAQIQNLAVGDAQISSLSANKITAGTITATVSMSAPSITGGSITGASFSVTSGAGVLTSITPASSGVVVSYSGQTALLAQGGLILSQGVLTSGLSLLNLQIAGHNVVGQQQTGPGNPSFTALSDAQTWCMNLLTALRSHGLVT